MVRTAQTLIDTFSGARLESHTQVPLELEPCMYMHSAYTKRINSSHHSIKGGKGL